MARHAQVTKNNTFAISLQYLKKKVNDEVDFLHADKNESLVQIDTMILMGIVKHSQSSQNSKFCTISQKKSKKSSSSKFLQVSIILFDGIDQTCPKYPK